MFVHEPPVLFSVDFSGCDRLARLETPDIVDAFVTALERAGATVVQTLSHAFPGAGLTSVLILRESTPSSTPGRRPAPSTSTFFPAPRG